MIAYTSQYQTKIKEFSNLYNLHLSPTNRWIQLGYLLPWDQLVKVYMSRFDIYKGAPGINPRVIIGSLIIKHKLRLSDDETVQTISENPYMQFFLGLDNFSPAPLFSPTLFVEIRKKLGKEVFDKFTEIIISVSSPDDKSHKKGVKNKGKLKLDATISDQYIRYPNDLGLLNEAREKTEKLIDKLFSLGYVTSSVKPRTYRKLAHQRYVLLAKKKNKATNEIRKEIRYQLNCIERNLRHIDKMLDTVKNGHFPLPHKYQRILWIVHTVAQQQRTMYNERSNQCKHRIVSLSQPHVRPMVRGKQGKNVEFGSKLGLSLANGYVRNETLSWDAYNESSDLITQANAYKALYGYYPELIQVDKIYGTNQNRKWCKQHGIRMTVSQKGKPKEKTAAQKRKERKEYAERNQVEGKIGNAKQALSLNQIKAKLRETSESWIGVTLFVLNIGNFAKIAGFNF